MTILVIGGAGFIGCHTVDVLLTRGYTVRVFDSLEAQVHGQERRLPDALNPQAEFMYGDIRSREMLLQALDGIDAILYLAATVGVGQSMYEIHRYVEVNTLGAANLLDILANTQHKIKKLVVASSMSAYGEGAYDCPKCSTVYPNLRSQEQLEKRGWELQCPGCAAEVKPVPTSEEKPLCPTSIYAITKRDQEEMCLCVGKAYGIPVAALRYFNVYGPRQALSNPYTGVAAIFCARMLNNSLPLIFEDGLQSRDFIHVRDIVQANILALEKETANGEVFNVGTGRPTTVVQLASMLSQYLGFQGIPSITQKYREGDIRHCFAQIAKIRSKLGYEPQITLEQGIQDLVEWVHTQVAHDLLEKAELELTKRGLVR